MNTFIEILKAVFLGIVEGITEWLPISSTGHMILVERFLQLNVSANFLEMFFIVIQLGAIVAVVILFWKKMFPVGIKRTCIEVGDRQEKKSKLFFKKDILLIWVKVIIACLPGAIVTLLFDDWFEAHFKTPSCIAIALIFYGIIFIVVEIINKKRDKKINTVGEISYLTALYIGLFQVLSIIPGTSRSGATIIGALILGVSRTAAAEFTFFLAVPVMLGYSALKVLKFIVENGLNFSGTEFGVLVVGVLTAFAVSFVVIKFLMNFIKKNDFKVFGYYRILLGAVILFLLFAKVL